MNQHDLLTMLQHHESNDDQIFAMSTLAVCSLGEHVRKRQVRQLIDIALESNQNIGRSKGDISKIKQKKNNNQIDPIIQNECFL